ncbi:hypothetical protein N7539_008290 [Penicillium diatomitis]|uniref:Uncharacterized protein n=1 Tax=Penicillium diatomitis TaxID=2819901 RepID=A0A9W9WTI7_9EURO|nr:uncharacterized protein N7539_008290 [Penicillium diatomitis]KAJ5475224.1 hypothetical protein N7539_008290 [Penicillium diatomitis]
MYPVYYARYYCFRREVIRRDLAALRLVSRAFCSSASRWLFMHIIANSASHPSKTPPLTRLLRISQSPHAHHVRQIDIGFRTADESYVEDLSTNLSDLLVKFPNLAALEFDGPPSLLSRVHKRVYMETIASVLHHVPLPNLKELELRFSFPQDFARFLPEPPSPSQIPLGDVMRRLRHLELCLDADIEGLEIRHGRLEPSIFPDDTSTSSQFFRLAEAASNLKSLAIQSWHILDVDHLVIPPSLSLRTLRLLGVSISFNVLLRLIDREFAPELSGCYLFLVRLKSGKWPQVLLHMRKLPRLVDFYLDFCGYSPPRAGSSSHLAPGQPVSSEQRLEDGAANASDDSALAFLLKHVNSNRISRGLQPFDDTEYRSMPERHMA